MQVDRTLLILGAAVLMLVGMLALVLSIQAERKRLARLQARLGGVTKHEHARPPAMRLQITRNDVSTEKTPLRRAMAVFGFDPAHSSHYPVPWAIVLVLSLLVARVVAGVLTILIDDIAFLAVPLIWVFLARAFFAWVDDRRREILRNQMPDALSMIVRSVRVGIPVTEAMRHVARQTQQPTSAEFERIASDLSIGTRLDLALKSMADRVGLPEYQFFATALSLQSQTGGGLTETLENLGDMVRKRVALKSKAFAMAAEARTSTMVLGALPFVSGLGLAVLSPAYISVLFTQQSGRNLLGVAMLSLATGMLCMRMIIRKSLK